MQNWRMKINFLLRVYVITGFLIACTAASAQVFDLVVAADGSGDFTGIQAALDAVPNNSSARTLIFVREGTYQEKVILSPSKINVSLIGESPGKVIISWNDYAGKDGMSSAETYTFWADANDFYAENISFENTHGAGAQALAMRTTGDRMAFRNCRFLGHQDTYYAHKRRQYNLNCFIEGTTDFIYGDATTVFDHCTLNCKKGGSYITAPADTKLVSNIPEGKFYHGLLFLDCDVKADADVSAASYYLGRPWQPDASSVFIHCRLGEHIKPAGWSTWDGNNHLSGCFAEYMNTDAAGNPVDTSKRAVWSKQLNQAAVENYYNLVYFLNKPGDAWDPQPVTSSSDIPGNMSSDGNGLSWSATDTLAGFMVYRNDSLIAFSETTLYNFTEIPLGPNDFNVRSVSLTGALSELSQTLQVFGPLDASGIPLAKSDFRIDGSFLNLPEPGDVFIYSLSGKLLKQSTQEYSMDVSGLPGGIYIVKLKNGFGKVRVQKIFIRSERN